MLDQHSDQITTNPSVPQSTAIAIQNDAASTIHEIDATRSSVLKGLRFKKRTQMEETTEERPVKRVKIDTEEPQAVSNDGGVNNDSGAAQNQTIDIPIKTLKKRGRSPKPKVEDPTLNSVQKNVPAKKQRVSKAKVDAQTLNGEEGALTDKPRDLQAKADVEVLNGEKDTPVKKPRTTKAKRDVEVLNGEKDIPRKKPRTTKAKCDIGALNGEKEKDTPRKKPRTTKAKCDVGALNGEKDTPRKKLKTSKVKAVTESLNDGQDTAITKPKAPTVTDNVEAVAGEKDITTPEAPKIVADVEALAGVQDPPTKKPKASKVKANAEASKNEKDTTKPKVPKIEEKVEALAGVKDTPTKREKASKVRVESPEVGTIKETLTKKEQIAKSKELAKLEPKWTVIAPPPDPAAQATQACEKANLVQTTHRPRVWMSNREEFLSVLPEMSGSKCFNGVSWELYETPILVFDEVNTAFRVICKDGDPRSIELVTTRKFVLPLREAQTKEQVPAPVQLQIQETVANPTAAAAEYLTKMEPTLLRFASTDPEIPAPVDTYHPIRVQPQRNRSPRPIDDMASGPEMPFTATRTNFNAPLPMYNAFNLRYDSIEPFFPSSTSVETSTTWGPSKTLPFGLPVADVIVQRTSEVYLERTVDIRKEPAPEQTNTSVLFPFLPMSDLAGPTAGITTESLTRTAGNMDVTDKDDSKKKKKTKKKTGGIPQRTSTRLKNLNGLVAQCDSEPAVQAFSTVNTAPESASTEDVVLPVPANLLHASDTEVTAHTNLESPDSQNSLLKQPSVTVAPSSVEQEMSIAKETLTDIVPTDNALNSEMLVETENPSISQPNVHQAENGSTDDPEFIPSPLPREIQTMIDAYLFGKPLTLIASREHLHQHWSLLLPEEFGYVMMGYFKIIGVQEKRMDDRNLPSLPVGLQSTVGYVNWSFHLQWRPGGEEYIMPKLDLQVLERPWWEPSPESDDIQPTSVPITKIEQQEKQLTVFPELEAEFATTPRYLQARLAHPEYQYRHDHFRELYECVLPSFLLAPFGALMLDSMLARGWYCHECGKVNYQSTLRHRQCSSPFCKEKKPAVDPFALPLIEIRDPQDRLPISFPLNVVPDSVATYVKTYKSGIKSISYSLKEMGGALVNHIFTGNVPTLQETATTLLESIQLQVELKRPFNDNTPYFSYEAKRPKGKKDQPIDASWENVPACINNAKAHLVDRVGKYTNVEKSRISITQLKLLAWVASGSRNGPEPLRATKKCIILLSFGCDIVLTLTPRLVGRSSEKNTADEHNGNDETADADTSGDVTGTVKSPKAKALKKSEKVPIVVYLVHGDCVVLDGDDFEYSLKRDGTSFLLIASHHEK